MNDPSIYRAFKEFIMDLRKDFNIECALNEALKDLVTDPSIDINTSKRSLQFNILGRVLKWTNISYESIKEIMNSHIPVHPQCSKILTGLATKDEDDLVQNFIPEDKLARIISNLANKHPLEIETLLAVDGFAHASITTTKNTYKNMFEPKRYLENLKFGLDGGHDADDSFWSSDIEAEKDKRLHVTAVRKMYKFVPETETSKSLVVNKVLRDLFLKNGIKNDDEEHVVQMKTAYIDIVGMDRIEKISKLYEGRIELLDSLEEYIYLEQLEKEQSEKNP